MAANYVIGDIQGCYAALMQLLDKIDFNERCDRLWFVGDLVNRGSQSLEVLRFIKNLPLQPRITLGNHDLHLLACLYLPKPPLHEDDTLTAILAAADRFELGEWLRQQPLLYHDKRLNVVMSHAGIAPIWTLEEAKLASEEVEAALQSSDFIHYLSNIYGNTPDSWSPALSQDERQRLITNYFTRMRFCGTKGNLMLQYAVSTENNTNQALPWFLVPSRKPIDATIVFGHWAALRGHCPVKNIYALDTGCVWGGALTALRLEDKKRFLVKGGEC